MGAFADGWDDLAAGDEIENAEDALTSELRRIRSAVQSLDPEKNRRPTAHILVPGDSDKLALPAGRASIDFGTGRVTHDKLDKPVTTDLTTIRDLSRRFEQEELQLRNLLFYTDTKARVAVENMNGQKWALDYTPLATAPFSTVDVYLDRPANLFLAASTKPMNIGLGTQAVIGTRVGEESGTLDSWNAVGVSPYDLHAQYGGTYADPTVATARYTSATWTIANQSGNGNEIDVQVQGASEDPAEYADAEWRELERITNVPDGDHALIEVTQEHTYMRARVTNSVSGSTVDAKVEMTEGTP